jgi:uncharacterized BrkB/YihY/UPF0761 family membrane protein
VATTDAPSPTPEGPARAGPPTDEAGPAADRLAVDATETDHESRIDRLIAGVARRVVVLGDWAEQRVALWWLVRDSWDRYWKLNGAVLAGHLAFRTFVWLLPVAVLMVGIAGFVRSQGSDPEQVIGEPMGLSGAVGATLRQAGEDSATTWYHMAWVAVVGLLFGSLGLYSGLHYVFLQLWQIPYRKVVKRGTATLRFAMGFLIVVAASFSINAVRKASPVIGTAGVLIVVAIVCAAFLGLGLLLPRRSRGIAPLVPGAVIGGLGVLGLQIMAVVYLPNRIAAFSATYGSLGVAASVIFYLYLLGNIVVIATIVNAVWWDHDHPDERPAPPAVPGLPTAAPTADRT